MMNRTDTSYTGSSSNINVKSNNKRIYEFTSEMEEKYSIKAKHSSSVREIRVVSKLVVVE